MKTDCKIHLVEGPVREKGSTIDGRLLKKTFHALRTKSSLVQLPNLIPSQQNNASIMIMNLMMITISCQEVIDMPEQLHCIPRNTHFLNS